MKITAPCRRPEQLSFIAQPIVKKRPHHRWKNDRCIHCDIIRTKTQVNACDCGCRTIITRETDITRYAGKTFVFGHETLDLFEQHSNP